MSGKGGTQSGTTPAHPLGDTFTLSSDDWNSMDPLLAVLAQDANGDDTYNNEKASIGYLETKNFLVIDEVTDALFNTGNEIKVNLIKLGKKNGISDFLAGGSLLASHKGANAYLTIHGARGNESARKLTVTRLTALNFAKLKEAGANNSTSFVSAALRARWIITGAYSVTKQDNHAAYNEVSIVKTTDNVYGRIAAASSAKDVVEALGKYAPDFVKAYGDENCGMKWVTRHAENIWAAVEHCFRVRSHHFKDQRELVDSYTNLYERYLEAAYEGEFHWPKDVPAIDIFRVAIHPFKLKALPVITAHYTAHGKVANAGITRMSGSPCGLAQITTSVAALDTMRAEAWWPAFEIAYGSDIEAAVDFARQINDDKYSYHISAGLYGLTRKTTLTHKGKNYTLDEAKSHVQLIASACQGMINALREAVKGGLITKFALQNAKALEKPAAANPLLALRITQLVSAALNAITQTENVKEAIANALPKLEKDATATAIVPVN